jgi:outer membrane protein
MKIIDYLTPRFTSLALAAFAATSLSLPSQAQPKIAVIDLKKVFDGYYKTKQADTQLKERAADFDKVRKGMLDDYQKAADDYKKLLEGANDQALSSEERDKRKATAEKKLVELKSIEQDITKSDQAARATLSEQQLRMRNRILDEIKEIITAKAKEKTFTLVLDSAAESANQTPILLFSSGENDLTSTVLAELNAKGPLETTPAPQKSDEKKDDRKGDKK